MADLSNTCEGTSGSAVPSTTAGAPNAFDSTTISGVGAAEVYDSAHAHRGTTSVRLDAPAGVSSTIYDRWLGSITAATSNAYVRFYVYATAAPSVAARLAAFFSSGTVRCSVNWTATGKLQTSNNAGSQIAATTASIPLNEWVRVEFECTGISGSTGTVTARMYHADGSAVIETLNNTAQTVGGTVNEVRFGLPGTTMTSAWSMWRDDVGWSATAQPGALPVAASGTGAIALTISTPAVGVGTSSAALTLSGDANWTTGATAALSLTATNTALSAAATTSAALTLTGSLTASAPVTATGALVLTGSATPRAPATISATFDLLGSLGATSPTGSSGSLSLTGSLLSAVPDSGSAALTLTGSITGSAPVTATGALVLTGSATLRAPATATATFDLSGSLGATSSTGASGSLSLTGSLAGAVPDSGNATLTLSASAGSSVSDGGTAAITLVALAGTAALAVATASLTLSLTGSTAAAITGLIANITLNSSAIAGVPASASAVIDLSGSTTAVYFISPVGAISLSATLQAAANAAMTGTLSLIGSTTPSILITSTAAINLTASASARVTDSGTLALSLSSSSVAAGVGTAAGSLSLIGLISSASVVLTASASLTLALSGAVNISGPITVIDHGDGTVTYSGAGVVNNGNGTFTLNDVSVSDNGDGSFTVNSDESIIAVDNGDGTVTYSGSGVIDNGNGTFTLSDPGLVDNGDGTFTVVANSSGLLAGGTARLTLTAQAIATAQQRVSIWRGIGPLDVANLDYNQSYFNNAPAPGVKIRPLSGHWGKLHTSASQTAFDLTTGEGLDLENSIIASHNASTPTQNAGWKIGLRFRGGEAAPHWMATHPTHPVNVWIDQNAASAAAATVSAPVDSISVPLPFNANASPTDIPAAVRNSNWAYHYVNFYRMAGEYLSADCPLSDPNDPIWGVHPRSAHVHWHPVMACSTFSPEFQLSSSVSNAKLFNYFTNNTSTITGQTNAALAWEEGFKFGLDVSDQYMPPTLFMGFEGATLGWDKNIAISNGSYLNSQFKVADYIIQKGYAPNTICHRTDLRYSYFQTKAQGGFGGGIDTGYSPYRWFKYCGDNGIQLGIQTSADGASTGGTTSGVLDGAPSDPNGGSGTEQDRVNDYVRTIESLWSDGVIGSATAIAPIDQWQFVETSTSMTIPPNSNTGATWKSGYIAPTILKIGGFPGGSGSISQYLFSLTKNAQARLRATVGVETGSGNITLTGQIGQIANNGGTASLSLSGSATSSGFRGASAALALTASMFSGVLTANANLGLSAVLGTTGFGGASGTIDISAYPITTSGGQAALNLTGLISSSTTLLHNDLEGSVGVGITLANSNTPDAFTNITKLGGSTYQFYNGITPKSGATCGWIHLPTGIATNAYGSWNTNGSAINAYARAYIYLTSYPSAPVTLFTFLQGTTNRRHAQINTDGTLSGLTPGQNVIVTTGSSVPLNTWVRVEFELLSSDAGSTPATTNLRFYSGNNGDSVIPDLNGSVSDFAVGNPGPVGILRTGASTTSTQTTSFDFYVDAIAYSDYVRPGSLNPSSTANGILSLTAGSTARASTPLNASLTLTGSLGARARTTGTGSLILSAVAGQQTNTATAAIRLAAAPVATGVVNPFSASALLTLNAHAIPSLLPVGANGFITLSTVQLISLYQDFECGTGSADTVTISSSNTDGPGDNPIDSVTIASGGAAVFDASTASDTGMSAHLTTVASGTTYLEWNPTWGTQTVTFAYCDVKISALPANAIRIISVRQSAGALGTAIAISPTGQLQAIDSSGTVVYTSAAGVVPTGAWFRVEYAVLHGTGSGISQIRLYTDLTASSPSFDSGQLSLSTGPQSFAIRYGVIQSIPNASVWIDRLGANNFVSWLRNLPRAVATGTINLSAQAITSGQYVPSAYNDLVMEDNPIIFMGDDTGIDFSGHGRNIDLINVPATTSMPDGSPALAFDGVSQYADAGDDDFFSPLTTGRWTFEAWVRPDDINFAKREGTGWVSWAGQYQTGLTEWHSRIYSANNTEGKQNRISAFAYNGSGSPSAEAYFQSPITVGAWMQVAIVINLLDTDVTYPNGYMKIYKNGILQATQSMTGIALKNTTAPFRIATTDLVSYLYGAIGKVAIYSTELSANRLLAHYQAMVPGIVGKLTLVAGPATGRPGSSMIGRLNLTGTVTSSGRVAGSALITLASISAIAHQSNNAALLTLQGIIRAAAQAAATAQIVLSGNLLFVIHENVYWLSSTGWRQGSFVFL